ncbi:MAG: hypothetical protein FJ104_16100, partial [Deltaproteobacteria bacterium]|nr:hypothetical protein [Deltaproteobacteria bacterium]
RTRVHAVVDFRGAPPPPAQLELLVRSGYLGAPPPQVAAPGVLGAGSPEAAIGEDGYAAFLTPSPGGRIVYFRVD